MPATVYVSHQTLSSRNTAGIVCSCLVAFFLAGYFATCRRFEVRSVEFLTLTLISLALSISVVRVLVADIRGRLMAWLVFAGLLGCYYLKFYLIVVWPSLMAFVPLPMASDPSVLSTQNLLHAYKLIVLAFAVMCITALVFYSYCVPACKNEKLPLTRGAFRIVVTAALMLCALTSILTFHYGMVMGTAITQTLPFHLRGIVKLSRETLVPMLLLVSFQYAMEQRRRPLILATLSLIILFGISVVILEGSKGGIGWTIIMAAFIPILLGRTPKIKAVVTIGLIILISVAALFPFMGSFREQRGSGLTLRESLELIRPSSLLSEDPSIPVKYLTMRLTGADAFLVLLSANRRPIGVAFWNTSDKYKWGIGGYMNEEIFQIPPKMDELGITSVAPSLLGLLYVVGGPVAIAGGMFLFTLGALLLWEWINRRGFIAGPAIEAVLLKIFLGAVTDGTLQLILRNDLTSFAGSAFIVENLAALGKPRFAHDSNVSTFRRLRTVP
jgi:hypothetical protein